LRRYTALTKTDLVSCEESFRELTGLPIGMTILESERMSSARVASLAAHIEALPWARHAEFTFTPRTQSRLRV